MQSMPFSEVRANLAETLLRVETSQEPLLISRRGEAAGVLLSPVQYQQLAGAPADFASRLSQWRAQYQPTIDVADPFAYVRAKDNGRDFSW